MIRKVFIAAILLALTSLTFAQTYTPRQTATRVFELVHATDLGTCADVANVLNEDIRAFDFVYCGGINDTLTLTNQRLTRRGYEQHGYSMLISNWEYQTFGPSFNRIPGYMTGFSNGRYLSVALLGIVSDGRRQITVILLAFNRI